MEQQVLHLLEATLSPNHQAISNAEASLLQLNSNVEFPFALLTIANHADIAAGLRQAALLGLKRYVAATWSPKVDDEFEGNVYLDNDAKAKVRGQVLELCAGPNTTDSKIAVAAASVTSTIASADFPDSWPSLFPTLMGILNGTGADMQVQNALRVLFQLVDSGFTEEQFSAIAYDLVNALQHVAMNSSFKPIVRALALSVFRSCCDTLQVAMQMHKAEVKGFLDRSLNTWMPFLLDTIRTDMPPVPTEQDEANHSVVLSEWRGTVALKYQVVKTLDQLGRISSLALAPHMQSIFEALWLQLQNAIPAFQLLLIDNDRQGKLTDSDGLPITLDHLVQECIDFLQVVFKDRKIKLGLEKQNQECPEGPHAATWLQGMIKLFVQCAQIPQEEEGLWEIDPNLYLSEMTSISANYTARVACAVAVVTCLGQWKQTAFDAFVYFGANAHLHLKQTWKEREATAFLLTALLKEAHEDSVQLTDLTSNGLLEYVAQDLHHANAFVRCGAHFAIGATYRVSSPSFSDGAVRMFVDVVIPAALSDESDVVRVSCIRAALDYVHVVPKLMLKSHQPAVISMVGEYIASHDLREDLEDAADIKSIFIETLREAIMIDVVAAMDGGQGIDLLFALASDGAAEYMLSEQLTEAFGHLVRAVSENGYDAYVRLCAKTLPSMIGAFDVADMTQESDLANLAAEFVSILVQYGLTPLPDGLVAAVMPKLNRVLLEANEAELIRPSTTAVQHILEKDASQLFAWTDSSGKSAVEVILFVIDRLLNSPDINEAAATDIGGLASAFVEKAGFEKLGPYLAQILQAIVSRLVTAKRLPFIQSLLSVFARLTTSAPKDVVDFLSSMNINHQSGLSVVLPIWVENSISFAGFEEVRENCIALSKLYSLQDPRIKQIGVKGELVIENTGRIKTRSQAKKNPDRYTTISADLKILKLLVEELDNAANSKFVDAAAAAAALDSENSSDAGDWEDVGTKGSGFLDLGAGLTKEKLMGYAADDDSPVSSRARDDETAEYLSKWFHEEASKPGFTEMYNQLNEEERAKLQALG